MYKNVDEMWKTFCHVDKPVDKVHKQRQRKNSVARKPIENTRKKQSLTPIARFLLYATDVKLSQSEEKNCTNKKPKILLLNFILHCKPCN